MTLATSLAVSVITGTMSAYTHGKLGNLNKPFAPERLGLMAGAGVGAALGAVSMTKAPPVFALLVIVAAQCFPCWSILRRGRMRAQQTAAGNFDPRALGSRAYFSMVGRLCGMGVRCGLTVR